MMGQPFIYDRSQRRRKADGGNVTGLYVSINILSCLLEGGFGNKNATAHVDELLC